MRGQLVGTQAPGRGCVAARTCGSTCHASRRLPAPWSREPGPTQGRLVLERVCNFKRCALRLGSRPGVRMPRTVRTANLRGASSVQGRSQCPLHSPLCPSSALGPRALALGRWPEKAGEEGGEEGTGCPSRPGAPLALRHLIRTQPLR